MDFDRILDKWENRRNRSGVSQGQIREFEKREASWLDRFPPDSPAVSEKNDDAPPPVSDFLSIRHKGPHQDTLDLHGLNGREAREEMALFIRSMRRRGLRKGLIIHGKGLHSTGGSVLAPLVREFLEMSREIGEFGRANRKNGGSGATWFILRHRSR